MSADESLFRWEDVDRRLLSPKTNELAEEMQARIAESERRISFETAQSLNPAGYLPRLFDFHEKLTNEWAERLYVAHCEAWNQQNRSVSPGFIRAIRDRPIAQLFAARKSAVKSHAENRSRRIGEPINKYALINWDLRMDRLAARWSRKLEAEAVACEYRAAREQRRKLPSRKPGRVPRLTRDFVDFAGKLWLEARRHSRAKVSTEQLRQISSKLDAKGYLPPAEYLEGNYAKELRVFNSRHSNSKTGAIKTWSGLVSLADKDHLRGMRRLLSRCAEKQTLP